MSFTDMLGGFNPQRPALSKKQIERYGWSSLEDVPRGRYEDIPKELILVDPTYQRDASKLKINAIARDWNWISCSSISVARRVINGTIYYYAIDGQHRVLAAMRRSDVVTLPCIVFDAMTVEQEASAFIQMQSNRKPVTSLETHKAKMVSGDRTAVAVEALVKTTGYRILNSKARHSVRCVGALNKLHETDSEALRKIWPFVCEIHDGEVISENILTGMFLLYQRIGDALFTTEIYKRRLIEAGKNRIDDSIRDSHRYHGTSTPKASALGIVKLINHMLTTNRIRVFELQD